MAGAKHPYCEVRNYAKNKKTFRLVCGFYFLVFWRSAFAANMELSKIAARSAWLLYRILNYVFCDFLCFGPFSYQILCRLVLMPLWALRCDEPGFLNLNDV